MDRNTVIGFVLIGVLLIGMFVMNSQSNQALQVQKNIEQHVKDSLQAIKAKANQAVTYNDSLQKVAILKAKTQQATAGLKLAPSDTEVLTVLENEVLKITFTNKGAQPKSVELKKFKTYDGKPLMLQTGPFNKITYDIQNGNNQLLKTGEQFFITADKKENADKSQSIAFSIKDTLGNNLITHEYTLKPDDYMVDFNISTTGADKLFNQGVMNLLWQTEAPQLEKTITYEKTQTHVCYYYNGKYNFVALGSGGNEKFDKPVEWVAVNPQFFVTSLLAKNKFQSAELNWVAPPDSLKIVSQTTANCRVSVPANGQVPLQLYYGPNDYNVLDKYNNNLHQVVTYGSGPFSFVKYINRHFLLPVWDFIREHVASYGIVILLLTLLIRLITSPILYKSYLSGAKMKLLKPEVDALKEKLKDKSGNLDQQAFSMEQMKLWKSAGVSPLGGCLPALLQIPIFMSLYYFFQANISLRGQSFLWAKDLAAYDSIWTFGDVPLLSSVYGDHVSLFTITATLTSLLISIYSMSNMQDNNNPVMKYMPYIFPVLLLGVFNRLPSALTWYYTVSNTITLLLQIVIQKYIIDHDKILAQIAENRKKPVKQSKLQERIQAMQESQKKIQDQKGKGNKK
ncbi:MAG: membrane protein insertase YidC [Ferruginibacter sp.]